MPMPEASARQKRWREDMAAAGCNLTGKYDETLPTRGASKNDHEKQDVLARNRKKTRTNGPAKMPLVRIEVRVVFQWSMMSRGQMTVCNQTTNAMIPIKAVVVDSEVV
jgi:hypothetical protein